MAGTRWGALVLGAALVLAVAWPWWRIPLDNADTAGMLAHHHALWWDQDLLYDDEYAALGMSPMFAFVQPESGLVSNHWPSGAVWLQAPGYLLGAGAAEIAIGLGWVGGGARWVFPLLGVRAELVALIALAFSWAYKTLRPHFGREGLLTVGALGILGTPGLYYIVEAPMRPHAWGFLVTLVFVVVWFGDGPAAQTSTSTEPSSMPPVSAESKPSAAESDVRAVLLGSLVGLATAIRPQLATLFILVLEDHLRRSTGEQTTTPADLALRWPLRPNRAAFARKLLLSVIGAGLLAGLTARHWFATQSWSLLKPPTRPLTHHVAQFLFSTHHGVVLWLPASLVVGVALVLAMRHRERGAFLIALLVLHQIWIDASSREIGVTEVMSSRTWAGGTGFAGRKLLDIAPLAAPALLLLFRRLPAVPRIAATYLSLLLCIPTVLLTIALIRVPPLASDVLDAPRLFGAFAAAMRIDSIAADLQQRAIPTSAMLLLGALITLPWMLLALVAFLGEVAARPRSHERSHFTGPGEASRSRGTNPAYGRAIATIVACAIAAHLWLSWTIVRTQTALEEDPIRMERARALLNPLHEEQVPVQNRAAAQLLRERIGSD